MVGGLSCSIDVGGTGFCFIYLLLLGAVGRKKGRASYWDLFISSEASGLDRTLD